MSTKAKVAILVGLVTGVIGLIVYDSFFRPSADGDNTNPETVQETTDELDVNASDANDENESNGGDSSVLEDVPWSSEDGNGSNDAEEEQTDSSEDGDTEDILEDLPAADDDIGEFQNPVSEEGNGAPEYESPEKRDNGDEETSGESPDESSGTDVDLPDEVTEQESGQESEQESTDQMEDETDDQTSREKWPKSYTVKKNDNYWLLAKRFYGSGKDWKKIKQANPNVKPEDLKEGMNIDIPAPAGAESGGDSGKSAASAPQSTGPNEYIVKKGDNYWKIAKEIYGEGQLAGKLRELNEVPPANLKPGMVINTPDKSELTGSSQEDGDEERDVEGPPREAGPNEEWHRVKKGERLWDISETYYGTGTKWRDIYEDNKDRIENPKDLKKGTWILIEKNEE